ncbi:MAG: ABC transporter ATP-binding protein [bacterium]
MGETTDLVIEARKLTKIFQDFWGRPKVCAVNEIDLEVRRGELFGLLGPNGSGKSTTIKMILGLLHPTTGLLTVLGQSPRNVAVKSKIGFMPEESYLYKYLTAAEILDFYASLYGLSGNRKKERVSALIAQVGLDAARNRPIGEFSKGMARRVGLAQCLLNDPDLILLDEPTSGLDPLACREVKDILLGLVRRGKTILICSHHLADMQDICDRVAILMNGKVCAEGAVKELLINPGTLRLSLESPSRESLSAILDYIEKETGTRPLVDHTGRTLESVFIETVKQRNSIP